MKKYLLSVFAIVLAISFSAFSFNKPIERNIPSLFFSFDPLNGSESQYTVDSYTYLGTTDPGPSFDVCPNPKVDFCIVIVNPDDIGANPGFDTDQQIENKFVAYLAGLAGSNPATAYLNANYIYKKP